MNKKKLLLIIGTVLLILLIILLRPRHIKLSLSDTEDFSVVREGNEVSLTQAEKSQLIDMIEDITVMPWLYPPASGWTYRILYTSADNRTNRIIVLDNKVKMSTFNAKVFSCFFTFSNMHISKQLYLCILYNYMFLMGIGVGSGS